MFRPLALAATLALAASPARADHIDRVLAQDAPGLSRAVRDKLNPAVGVAVLKFQTQVGNARPSFSGGVENTKMVERMQNLLVATNDDQRPVTVLGGAGEAAAAKARRDRRAFDWTTPEGREALFELSLPVVWNPEQKLTPDAYVTGVVRVNSGMGGATIDFYGFARSAPEKLVKLCTVTDEAGGKPAPIAVDRTTLADLGQSFALPKKVLSKSAIRKGVASRRVIDLDASASAAGTDPDAPARPDADARPIDPAQMPVILEVLYDNSPQTPEADPGSAREEKLATPAAGQRVAFRLQNTLDYPVGVMLAVNGANTIAVGGETMTGAADTAKFRLWVLRPGVKYDVSGFLKDEKGTFAPFQVLSEVESAARYDTLSPEYAGRVEMRVYGKTPPAISPRSIDSTAPPKEDAKIDDLNEEALAAAGLATPLGKKINAGKSASEAKRLTQSLLGLHADAAGSGLVASTAARTDAKRLRSKGIIVENSQTTDAGAVEVVKLEYEPTPIANRVIRYYSHPAPDAPVAAEAGPVRP